MNFKSTLIGLAVLLPVMAEAGVNLKQVQVSQNTQNASQVELLFDGKVGKGQIRTEFFNDIIQISLTDASVYPAKISSVTGGNLTKIFAYQYAPKLVRCRLSVKGKAETYKDRLRVTSNGKILTVRFSGDEATDQLTTHSARAVAVPAPPVEAAAGTAPTAPAAPSKDPREQQEEKKLLERVLKNETPPVQPVASAQTAIQQAPLASGKPLSSPIKAFGKLAGVLALFALIAIFAKKWLARGGNAGMVGAIARFAKNGIGRNGKMIEVVATHYLGPKKSIAVVRVAGRLLVLGITNESINLISQISEGSSEAPSEALLGDWPETAGPAVFSDLLSNEKDKPATYSRSAARPAPSVRAKIRDRLEGLKPL